MHRTKAAAFALFGALVFGAIAAPAEAAAFKLVYSFQGGADGAYPQAAPVAVGHTLYGTTLEGGSNGLGTLYSLDLKSGTEKLLYTFGAGTDGAAPAAGLLKRGKMLYGTASSGGTAEQGTIFSLDLTTGNVKTLYSFQGGTTDGSYPQSRLIEIGGLLYGTTLQGGSANCYLFGCGTIFSVDPASGAEKIVYFFQGGNDGADPAAGLVQINHKLYGTTDMGAAGDCGTVFMFDLTSGVETVMHEFDRQGDGTTPGSGLFRMGNMLYGSTISGGVGDPGDGTIFAIDRKTGMEQVVHAFTGDDGAIPEDSPIAANKLLYATTSIGGTSNNGTIIALDPATGASQVAHNFAGSDGSFPWADLIKVGNRLYGTAFYGGATGNGVIFSIAP